MSEDGYGGQKHAEHEAYLAFRAKVERKRLATTRKGLTRAQKRARKKQAHKQRLMQRRRL